MSKEEFKRLRTTSKSVRDYGQDGNRGLGSEWPKAIFRQPTFSAGVDRKMQIARGLIF